MSSRGEDTCPCNEPLSRSEGELLARIQRKGEEPLVERCTKAYMLSDISRRGRMHVNLRHCNFLSRIQEKYEYLCAEFYGELHVLSAVHSS
jgi:hypothetical protein